MGVITEFINYIATMRENVSGKINNLAKQWQMQTKYAKEFGVSQLTVGMAMDQMGKKFSKGGEIIDKNIFGTKKMTKVQEALRRSTKGFRGEYLTLMFTAWAVNRAMMGILSPAFEMVGTFSILSEIIGIAFLPVATGLLDILLPIALWFLSLDENTRTVIGTIIFVIATIASVIAALGMFGLAIPLISTGIGILIGVLGPLLIPLAGIALAIGLVYMVFTYWDKIPDILKPIMITIAGLLFYMMGPLGWIAAAVMAAILIWKNWDKIVKFFTDAWNSLQSWWAGFWPVLLDALLWPARQLWNILTGIWTAIPEGFRNMLKGAWDWGVNLIKGFIDGILSMHRAVFEAIWNILPEPIKAVLSGIGGMFGLGLPAAQAGGFVASTGAAVIHKGETIVPAGAAAISFNPTINISGTAGVDARSLANEIFRLVEPELRRIASR